MCEWHKIRSFGIEGLSSEQMINLFSDGRFASQVVTKLLTKWYPALKEVKEQYVSHRDFQNNPYLLRMFTNGCKFMPSSQIGVGRRFNATDTRVKGQPLTVAIVGATEFPNIWVNFISFEKLIHWYPNAHIPEHDLKKIMSYNE